MSLLEHTVGDAYCATEMAFNTTDGTFYANLGTSKGYALNLEGRQINLIA